MDAQCYENEHSDTSVLGPGNSTYFDLSRKGLKSFPTHFYNDCTYVQVTI